MRWLAAWAFLASLTLVFFEGSPLRGFHFVFLGAFGLVSFDPFHALPWLANFFFLGSFITRSGRFRSVLVFLALSLASLALGIARIPGFATPAMVAVSPGPGFWVWLSAYLLLAIDAALGAWAGIPTRRERKS